MVQAILPDFVTYPQHLHALPILPPIVISPACDMPRSRAIGVLTMEIGCTGAHVKDATRRSVRDWPRYSNGRAGVVRTVDCTSNMVTSWRLTTSMGIDEMPAIPISKSYMDTGMTRKPGPKVNTYR
jgi:hypothetical protein